VPEVQPARETKRRAAFTHWRREALVGILFALPWMIHFLALTLGPMLFSLYASFTTYNIVSAPRWIGTANYRFIFTTDERFRLSLYNTLYYVVVRTPFVIVFSLIFAILLNNPIPGKRVFRTIFYLPTVITGVAAIFLWIWVLNPAGLLNRGLALVGIRGPNWFYDPNWSKPGLIVMSMWYLGSPMLIFLAGLQDVPQHLYEAAEIDGAGTLSKFWSVTLPLLSPTIFFQIVTAIIGGFQVFNTAFVVSITAHTQPGDPAQSLLFYAVYLYLRGFRQLQMGFASALAWILFVMVLVVTLIQVRLSERWVFYAG
jgi:multiple sugar transport system permease protein